jgi:hypothetical protein
METSEIEKKANWRLENLRKANETRKRKKEERRLLEEKCDMSSMGSMLTSKVEVEVANRKVGEALDDVESRGIKSDFYKVFEAVGGVSGMVAWIKKDQRHRLEYYKMLVSILKSESTKQQSVQKQGVIVNIITPDQHKQTLLGEVEVGE